MGRYTYYTDPGHGWLAVPHSELVELGISDSISSDSYRLGDTIFLEEDLDMGAFFRAKGWEKYSDAPIDLQSSDELSFIRDLPRYC